MPPSIKGRLSPSTVFAGDFTSHPLATISRCSLSSLIDLPILTLIFLRLLNGLAEGKSLLRMPRMVIFAHSELPSNNGVQYLERELFERLKFAFVTLMRDDLVRL